MYFLLGSTTILPASVQTLVRFRYWHSHLSTFRSETRLEPVAVILWSNHKQAIYVNCDVHTFDLVFIHAVAIPISSVFAHAGIPTRTKSRCGTVKNASLTSVTNILLNCCTKASTKSTWIIHLLDIGENVCSLDASPLRNSRATHLARVATLVPEKRQSNTKRVSRIISSPFGTKLLNRTSSSSEAWSNWAIIIWQLRWSMILHLLLKGKIRLFIFIKIKETLFTRHLNTMLIWLHLKIYSTIVCSQSNVTSICWTRLQTSSALLCITLLHHICCAMFLWLTLNPRLLSISPCIISFQTAFTGPSPPSGTIPALKGNWPTLVELCWLGRSGAPS